MRAATLVGMMVMLSPLAVFAANKCAGPDGKVIYADKECASMGKDHVKTLDPPPLPDPAAMRRQQEMSSPAKAPVAAARATQSDPAQTDRPEFLPFTKHPASPTIRIYYDQASEPRNLNLDVDSLLRGAVSRWNQGCNVNLDYAGRVTASTGPDAKVIRWGGELGGLSVGGSILGRAQMGGSNAHLSADLSITLTARRIERVMIHEIGHLLGIGHNPYDPRSIMYPYSMTIQDANTRGISQNDLVACNLAMRTNYRVPYELPAEYRSQSR